MYLATALVDDPGTVLITDSVAAGIATVSLAPAPVLPATTLTVGLTANNDIDWIHSKAGSTGLIAGTTAAAGLTIYNNQPYCIAIYHAADATTEWHIGSNGTTQTLAPGVCP